MYYHVFTPLPDILLGKALQIYIQSLGISHQLIIKGLGMSLDLSYFLLGMSLEPNKKIQGRFISNGYNDETAGA